MGTPFGICRFRGSDWICMAMNIFLEHEECTYYTEVGRYDNQEGEFDLDG